MPPEPAPLPPLAFLSYTRFDDEHSEGRISELRKRLSTELRAQTGKDFPIFQDRNDILWGQNWEQRIEQGIDGSTFLIPILTPSFFESPACRKEVEMFMERERKLGRNDLILPVYYIETPQMHDETLRERDPVVKRLCAGQWMDWRELRFDPLTTPQVGKLIAQMAGQMVTALRRNAPASPAKPLNGAARQDASAPASPPASPAVPAVKTEMPTLVVDALHRGHCSSVSEAIRRAIPGTRILVKPGLYRESLVIDKALEIIGDGPREDIVVESGEGYCIAFRASMGRVANLSLRKDGQGKFYAVDISQGRLDLEDCDITSRSLCCIGIHDGADPRVRRNRVHDGTEGGLIIFANGQGTIEDNEIHGNSLAGITVTDGCNPIIRRNRIHGSKQGGGLFFLSNSQGIVEDNEIFDNAFPGVEIKGESTPIIRRNRIHGGQGSGVRIHTGGHGTIEDNEIFENAASGIVVHEAKALVVHNQIRGNREHGISVLSGASGVFKRNRLAKNGKGAWYVMNGVSVDKHDNVVE